MSCTFCKQTMQRAAGCIPHFIFPAEADGRPAPAGFEPIPYGDDREGWKKLQIEPPARCHDCFAQIGRLHHPGCDLERCPVCAADLDAANRVRIQMGFRRVAHLEDASMQAFLCQHCQDRRPIEAK